MHFHSADDARETPQHMVEGDEAVGQNHPLDRRMRDVALALDHLRGDRLRLEPETIADVLLNFWRQIRERADRSGKLSNADRRPGAPHAVGIASDFGVPQRQLEPERYRLGVDAVRAPD